MSKDIDKKDSAKKMDGAHGETDYIAQEDGRESGGGKEMPFGWALFCIGFLLVSMVLSVLWLDIPIHINLLTSMAVTLGVAWLNGKKWDEIFSYIEYGGKVCIAPTLTMMIVGIVIGSWIASGTVPMIIYWGLKMINPAIFLAAACVVCAITSISTGSSWSTAGTVGIALMAVGGGLGINPAMTGGAIISGAYFGDKMSPMSDTTNLAPAVAEADIFDHIRSMVYTSGPAFLITLVFYGVLGLKYTGHNVDNEAIAATMESLKATFNLNPLVLLPPVIVIAMAVLQKPAIPTLLISSAVAGAMAMIFQGASLTEITTIMDTGFKSETGIHDIDVLLSRGGLQSMLWTAALGMLGMLYGSIMEKSGLLEAFLKKMKLFTNTLGGLVTVVVLSCIILLAATASQTLAIVVGGRMYISEFRKKNLLPQTLSRTLEDSGTIVSPLIPWSLCGVYMAGTLGVSTMSYLPFAIFCWICPILAVIYGFTGKFFWKTGEKSSKRTYAE
ncbi:Na+/H+ antiporter NhaC [Lachnospiraceae bacterium 62-35]